MRFARVQGHGSANIDLGEISIVVTLDLGNSALIVRRETVPWLAFGPEGDVSWQIDQYTQETIGYQLADQGWEPVSEDGSRRSQLDDGLVHSASYVVRQMSTFESAGDEA